MGKIIYYRGDTFEGIVLDGMYITGTRPDVRDRATLAEIWGNGSLLEYGPLTLRLVAYPRP